MSLNCGKCRQIFHTWIGMEFKTRTRRNMCLPQKNYETSWNGIRKPPIFAILVLLVDPIQQLTTFFASARLLLPCMDAAYLFFFCLSRRENRRLRNPSGKKYKKHQKTNLLHPSDSIKTWGPCFYINSSAQRTTSWFANLSLSRCVPKKTSQIIHTCHSSKITSGRGGACHCVSAENRRRRTWRRFQMLSKSQMERCQIGGAARVHLSVEAGRCIYVYAHISMHPNLQTMDHSSWNLKQQRHFSIWYRNFRPINQFSTISLAIFPRILPPSSLGLPRFMRWVQVGCVWHFVSKYTVDSL